MNLEQATPLFNSAQASKRKPGRSKGATAKVMQDARALGVHHFAFVRSSILGLDLAETINGLYKAELIHRRTPWKTKESLELATLEWVSWFRR